MQLMARIGGPRAADALQRLVHDPDPQRSREAVAALVRLDDASGQRALASLLKSGTADERAMAVEALASSHDPRSVELLAVALKDTPPFGASHALVLHIIAALRRAGDDRAVDALAFVARAFGWVHLGQSLRLKRAAVNALAALPGTAAADALHSLSSNGDYFLRRYALAARQAGG